MPGFPFAVGGPSKNTQCGAPSRAAIVWAKRSSSSHRASSSRSTSSADRSAGSNWYFGKVGAVKIIARGSRSQPFENAAYERGQFGFSRVGDGDDPLERRRLQRIGQAHVRDDR